MTHTNREEWLNADETQIEATAIDNINAGLPMARYFVADGGGDIVSGPFGEVSDAVLAAARYDGWGACYQRDEAGKMRLYSSPAHLGNNAYIPAERDAFFPASEKANDGEAIAEVAREIFRTAGRRGFHNRWDMDIVTVTYDAAGQIKTIDGDTLAARNEHMDDPAEAAAQDAETFALIGD